MKRYALIDGSTLNTSTSPCSSSDHLSQADVTSNTFIISISPVVSPHYDSRTGLGNYDCSLIINDGVISTPWNAYESAGGCHNLELLH